MINIAKVSGRAKALARGDSNTYFYSKDASRNTLGFLTWFQVISFDNVDAVHMYSWWNPAILSDLVFTINTYTESPTKTQVPTTTTLPSMIVSSRPSIAPSIIFSIKPSTEPTDLPSVLPSIGNSCDGKEKGAEIWSLALLEEIKLTNLCLKGKVSIWLYSTRWPKSVYCWWEPLWTLPMEWFMLSYMLWPG